MKGDVWESVSIEGALFSSWSCIIYPVFHFSAGVLGMHLR